MKNISALALALSIGLFGFAGGALSEETSDLPREVSKYNLTGEMRKCVRTVNIQSSRPLDDHHILFRMRNGDIYLNRLGQGCSGLSFNGSYSYRNRIAELCNNEIITVVDTFNPAALGSCGLGQFEKLERKDQAKAGDGA